MQKQKQRDFSREAPRKTEKDRKRQKKTEKDREKQKKTEKDRERQRKTEKDRENREKTQRTGTPSPANPPAILLIMVVVNKSGRGCRSFDLFKTLDIVNLRQRVVS